MRIPPPHPLPYLDGIAHLPDELRSALDRRQGPTPAEVQEARRVVNRLRRLIRLARHRWEQAHGVQIDVEPPWEP